MRASSVLSRIHIEFGLFNDERFKLRKVHRVKVQGLQFFLGKTLAHRGFGRAPASVKLKSPLLLKDSG